MPSRSSWHTRWAHLMERHEREHPPKPLLWLGLAVVYLIGGIGFLLSAFHLHLVLAVIFLISCLGSGWRWRRDSVRSRGTGDRPSS
jgi:membrane protein implicated in regulation of membrane protease activity